MVGRIRRARGPARFRPLHTYCGNLVPKIPTSSPKNANPNIVKYNKVQPSNSEHTGTFIVNVGERLILGF